MKKISFWARNHCWQARFFIIISYIILNFIGLYLGDALSLSGIVIPGFVIYLTGFIFLTAFIFYPLKGDKTSFKNFYRRQKSTDLVLITTTFLLIISFGNRYNTFHSPFNASFHSVQASASKPASTLLNKNNNADPVLKKKKGSKILKQKLKENIRLLRKEYKGLSKGEKNLLIVLSILIGSGLLALITALSCNLACSGAGGAALAVLIFGTGLIVFLLAKIIKRLSSGKPKKETDSLNTTSG